ncbi:hypothetical protein T484DRAFT_1839503 [Baffinella frigidus]|nr:hypothetical protein T484DRAFT_1839503 [Cryptophyta sp. CCMP2293]
MRGCVLLLISCLAQGKAFAFVPSFPATLAQCSVARCSQGAAIGALRAPTTGAPIRNKHRSGEGKLLRMGVSEMEKKQGELLNSLLLQRSIQTQLYYYAEFRDDFKRQWLEVVPTPPRVT